MTVLMLRPTNSMLEIGTYRILRLRLGSMSFSSRFPHFRESIDDWVDAMSQAAGELNTYVDSSMYTKPGERVRWSATLFSFTVVAVTVVVCA